MVTLAIYGHSWEHSHKSKNLQMDHAIIILAYWANQNETLDRHDIGISCVLKTYAQQFAHR